MRLTSLNELTDGEILDLGPDDFFYDELDQESYARLDRIYIAAQRVRWWRFLSYTDGDFARH